MPKPHLLQLTPYPEADQTPLDAAFIVHRYFDAPDQPALLATVGPLVDAIATNGGRGVSAAILAACPRVQIVAVYGVGYDAVDLAPCRARGIRVTNTPDVLTDDVADLAVAMMLALARGIVAADANVRSGAWAATGGPPLRHRVSGARAGILGLGRIGTAIAQRCAAFGMPIAYSARRPKDVPADWAYVPDPVALAAQSDHLFVALAATAETRHVVGPAVLRALGPAGRLINISRAANIDESALLDALEAQTIAGAALDVFEGEPNVNSRFLPLRNVLLQPHHGSATVETRAAMGQLMRDNLTAHFAGLPLPSAVV
ncbi:MAG: 2-hydroxyacid dehydrogenase [Rhodobacteraceae bacterium]|nr:2-hydroxyacid dehydrogenase [Paracoccaceae bacterium]